MAAVMAPTPTATSEPSTSPTSLPIPFPPLRQPTSDVSSPVRSSVPPSNTEVNGAVQTKDPTSMDTKSPELKDTRRPEDVESKGPTSIHAMSPQPIDARSPEPIDTTRPESVTATSPESTGLRSPASIGVKSPESGATRGPVKLRANHHRRRLDREFAYGLVYHEAIARGAGEPQARRAVEAEHMTHSRANQLTAARELKQSRSRRQSSAQPQPKPYHYNDYNTPARTQRPSTRPSFSSLLSEESSLAPRPISILDLEPPRGRSAVRTPPPASPARLREPNHRHLHQHHHTRNHKGPEPWNAGKSRYAHPRGQQRPRARSESRSLNESTRRLQPERERRHHLSSDSAEAGCMGRNHFLRRVSPCEAEDTETIERKQQRRVRVKRNLHHAVYKAQRLPGQCFADVKRNKKHRRLRRESRRAQAGVGGVGEKAREEWMEEDRVVSKAMAQAHSEDANRTRKVG